MSAVWTVATREIRARRLVLAAIPIVAALPFLAGALGSQYPGGLPGSAAARLIVPWGVR